MKSIISNEYKCLVCGNTLNLHRHHIYYGTANRKLSEKYGCWCYLCGRHHNLSDHGVHFDLDLDLKLKAFCEEVFLEHYHTTEERFREIFGQSWL